MFGKRPTDGIGGQGAPEMSAPQPALEQEVAVAESVKVEAAPPMKIEQARPSARAEAVDHGEEYYDIKTSVFAALIETIDLSQLALLDPQTAREEIRDIVNDIIALKNLALSISKQEALLDDICNDVLGYGPLEPLLARDDIADIMVNGANTTFIEVDGKVQKTGLKSVSYTHLTLPTTPYV